MTTESDVEGAPEELSIYVTEGYWTKKSLNVRRYSMRMDGFVSFNAPSTGAEFVTRRIVFAGETLEINFSTSGAGGVWVEVQDADGTPLKGFTEAVCHEIFGDEIERTVTWKQGQDVSSLSGKPVRLRIV